MRFKKLGALILGALLTIGVAAGIGATVEKDRVKATASEIVFDLGENGDASHSDGSSKTTYSETVSDYTLSLTDGASFYTGARDAKGNSCIKLGTSSKAGSFSLTAPNDVTSVIFAVGKYKANTTNVNVAGETYTLTNSSNDGAYDEITVDTSSNKDITFATVTGGLRAMLNTITYVIGSSGGSDEPEEPTLETQTITASANTVEVESSITLTTNADTATWTITTGQENATLSSTVGQEVSLTGTSAGSVTVEAVADGYTDATIDITVNPAPFVPNLPTEDEGEYIDATLSFADTAQRTSIDKSSQVWEQNNIVFTNSSSTSNIADYSNPVRLYANTKVTVTHESEKISEIVFVCDSATYATALNNSIFPKGSPTYRSSVSEKNVTVEFASLVQEFVIETLSAQVRLDSLVVTYFEPNDETPDLVITVPNDAKEFKVGQQIELSTGVDETKWSISSNTATLSATTGDSVVVTGIDNGKVTITASKDDYNSDDVDLTFYYTVNTLTAKAELVTDAEELAEGDKIIIAAADYNFALSEIQNTNNRSTSQDIEKIENIANVGCSVEIITLEKGSVDGTFAFKTDEGYLSAITSTDKNHLVSEDTINANSSWLISIADGVTTAISQVEKGKNNLRFNNTNKLFSCYADGQYAISIYRLTGDTDNKEVRVSDNAIDFAQNIYTEQLLVCDQEGIDSTINWEQITNSFNALTNVEDKLLIKGVIGNEHGNELEKFISTYDFLVTEKGYTDFIGRFESSTKGAYSEFKVFNNDITLIIALVAIVALSGFAFFYVAKRKNKEFEF